MNFPIKIFKSLRFWLVLKVPILFIILSLFLMKTFKDKRDQLNMNEKLINRFNELEAEFQDIQYDLPLYGNVDGVLPGDVWQYNQRVEKIFSTIDSLHLFLTPGVQKIKPNIEAIDSMSRVMNRAQITLFSKDLQLSDEVKLETEMKDMAFAVINLIKISVEATRKDLVRLSNELNSLWNWLFYMLITACFLGILVIIFFVLYRVQRIDTVQAQESLVKSEERNKALLNAVPDLIFRISADGTFLDYNPSKNIETYAPPEFFLGKKTENVFEPELAVEINRKITETILTGEVQYYEYQLELNGRRRDYEARIAKSGEAEVIAMIRDITERKRIQEDLRISKERYSLAVNAANVGVWDWDLRTGGIYLEPKLKKMLGFEDDEIPNRLEDWRQRIHPEDLPDVEKTIKDHLKGLTATYTHEHRMVHKNGSILWFFTQGKAILNEKGKPYRMVGTDVNISLRRKAEEALRRSEEQLRMITDSVPSLISYITVDYKYKFNNKAYERIFGVKREDILGQDVREFLGPKTFERTRSLFEKALRGEEVRFGNYVPMKGSAKLYFDVSLIPDKDDKGNVIGIYASLADITDLKKAEEKLAESEARLRSIIDNINDVIITIDKKGKVLSINKIEMGFSPEQVVGKNLFSLLRNHTERKRIKEGVLGVFSTSQSFSYEVNFEGLDGNKVWYSCIASPIVKQEKVDAVIIVCRDITEEKLADEAVINAMIKGQDKERKRIAEELHDSLGQVLSSISMNFNVLESKIKEKKLKPTDDYVDNIRNLLSHAVNEIRNISHALMPEVLEEFGLVSAVQDLADKLESTSLLKLSVETVNMGKRLDKNVEVALYRITQELINNIVKHAKAEQVSVQLINHGDSVVLMIEDDGVGFDAGNGHDGIGLRNIVSRTKLLKGELIIDSSFGKGTIVTVEIPLNGSLN